MTATTPRDYQLLLDLPRGRGMVLSCYADTTVAEGFEPHWREHLENEARRVRPELAGDPEASGAFERQVELIRRGIASPQARGARGVAVFAAPGWDQPFVIASDAPFDDRLVVDEEPYVVPLLVDHLLRPRYLAVQTDTHRGRIYEVRAGEARLLDQLDEDVPSKNRSAGERWGKQQATIARHREDHILHYFKHLADRVDAAWAEGIDRGIVLLGEHEVLEDFRTFLPDRLADRVVGEVPRAWAGDQPAIEDQVAEVVSAIRAAEERRLLDDIDRRLNEGFAVTTGPQEVIVALADGQVRTLVFGPDLGEVAWRCPGCRSLFVTEEEACPYCKAPCERANLWQEILSRALNHRVDVQFVRSESGRSVPGGIAALLLRDEPQWTSGRAEAMPPAARES